MWALALVYAALRFHSGAMLPSTAPPYYRLSANPSLLMRNVREYADRACSLSALVLVVIFALVRTRPALNREQWSFVGRCLCWLVGGFAVTIFLPIRSSLYALFPSVGAVLAASTLASTRSPFFVYSTSRARWLRSHQPPTELHRHERARARRSHDSDGRTERGEPYSLPVCDRRRSR